MKRARLYAIAAAAGIALIAWGLGSAAEMSWVSTDVIDLDEKDAFDLSDLADGEERTFGSGDKRITVARKGNQIIITHGGEKQIKTVCTVDRDECKILTFDGDPERIGLIIKKVGGLGDGEDCDHDLATLDLHDGDGKIMVVKTVGCGGGEGPHSVIRIDGDEAISSGFVKSFVLGGEGHRLILGTEGGGVMLRCPEGDTTMHVEEEDADQVFLCPMHSVPLEKVEGKHRIHKIMIHEEKDE
jgi:hypothetical protein